VSEIGAEGQGRMIENRVCVRARYSEAVSSRSASTILSETYENPMRRDSKES